MENYLWDVVYELVVSVYNICDSVTCYTRYPEQRLPHGVECHGPADAPLWTKIHYQLSC